MYGVSRVVMSFNHGIYFIRAGRKFTVTGQLQLCCCTACVWLSRPFIAFCQHSYSVLIFSRYFHSMGRVAQSVQRLTMGWRVRDRIPVGKIFLPSRPALGPTQPPVKWVPGLPGVKCGRGVLLTTHPFQCRGHGRVELYLYPPSGPHRACNGITLPLPFSSIVMRDLTPPPVLDCVSNNY